MKKTIRDEFNQVFRIMSTQAVMRSQIIANTLNINSTDLESIEVLFREGRTTAGTLAEFTGLTTGAITGVIDRLVRRGFVSREFDANDRRKVFIALNMKKINEEIIPLYKSISGSVDELLNDYSEKDLFVILDFLKKTINLSQKDLDNLKKE